MLKALAPFKYRLTAFFILLLLHGMVPAVESPAVIELRRAQKVITDKAEELKATDLAAYSTLMAAVKDLDKYTKDSDVTGSKLLVQLLTPANLKKLFKAPARIDKATGEVSVGYDFSDAATIQDWAVGKSKPEYKKGALAISPLDSLTHKAQWFGKVTIVGKVQLGNRAGIHLSTTTGWQVDGHSYNAWLIGFLLNSQRKAEQTFSDQYTESADTQFTPFTWELSNRTSLSYGKATIAVPLDQPFAGSFSLCGGQGGNLFKEVIVTGTLDTNWVKQALGVGAP